MSVYREETNETVDTEGNVIDSEVVQVDVTEETNKSAIQTNLEADLVLMQAILDDTNANINSNPAARIKEMCRMLKRLGRTAINDYSEAD